MITLLAIIFVLLLIIGMIALAIEASVYIIPVLFVAWIFKMIDRYYDKKDKKDSSQE